MNTLGERIKDAANEIGGLKQLAESIPTARRTLGDWVNNTSEPKAGQIVRISDLTGVEVQWLLIGMGTKFRDHGRSSLSPNGSVLAASGEANASTSKHPDIPDHQLHPEILVDIEQAIQSAYSSVRGAIARQDALRLSIDWYNDIARSGVSMFDGREIAVRIYDRRKVLEEELKSRASGKTSGKRQGS